MPTYHYFCSCCGHQISLRQSMTDPNTLPCEACHQGVMTRQIKGGSFLLRGSGWYQDGYLDAANQAPKSSGKESQGSGEPSSGGSSSASSAS